MSEERFELNDSERNWLDQLLANGRMLVVGYGLDVPADALPTLRQVDAVLPLWAAEAVEQRVHANDVVHAFGAVLGAHLCRDLGLRWILVRDEDGTELAVNGDPADIVIYPVNATAKRLTRGEVQFFEQFIEDVTREVGRLRGS